MNSIENVLSFMDLLDLDEELVDTRLKCLMSKEKHANKHLVSILQLLQYKQLVNLQDECDCDNDTESDFAAKLIKETCEENVDIVCKIVPTTLGLNGSTLVNKSEHLVQQILSSIDLPKKEFKEDNEETTENRKTLIYFKICDSILDIVIKSNEKLTLPFLEVPIKSILSQSDEKLKTYFLNHTVTKLFEAVKGYNILDKIWNHIKPLEGEDIEVSLKVLSSLSDYYLPVPDEKGNILFKSTLINQCEFWQHILHGLLSIDPSLRKISMYLAKRALDCIIVQKKEITFKLNNITSFHWRKVDEKNLKAMWDNFFVLMDSLEEKQSNIVLPSLQLFESLKSLGGWLNCAFNIGLKHDNTQVRLKCIQHRLQTKLKSQSEAVVLLEAINDINIFDDPGVGEDLKREILTFVSDVDVFAPFLTSIPHIKWSPVPFFHITSILCDVKLKSAIEQSDHNISQTVIDILKVPCNNIPIRKAAFINISHFVGFCSTLHWNHCINIYFQLHKEIDLHKTTDNPFVKLIKKLEINEADKGDFYKLILGSHMHIDCGLLYLESHLEDLQMFNELVIEKIQKVQNIVSRQYSNKTECLNDVIYLTSLFDKTKSKHAFESTNLIIGIEFDTILRYVLCLLSDNTVITVEEMNLLSYGLKSISTAHSDNRDTLLQLYKTCVLFIKDKHTSLESTILCMFLLNVLSSNQTLVNNYKQEMLNLEDLLKLTMEFENKNSIGKLRNVFYEKSCELVDYMVKELGSNIQKYVKDVAEYTENIIECGGYGCLRYCLKIMNGILTFIIVSKIKLNIEAFISRMWKEIEELKSNNQYNPCMEEFVNLITHNKLLKTPMYNNIVILYSKRIVEYGPMKCTPLFYLVRVLNRMNFDQNYGQLIYILSEVLLYSPVPRKDQRILENLAVQVLQDPKYTISCSEAHFNFQIQYISVLALSKITDAEILSTIEVFLINRVEEVFRNKQRYHGHSQAHRTLVTALQHLLFIQLLRPNPDAKVLDWCVDLLGRLPHQPSVKTFLEWYISLQFCIKKTTLNEEVLELLKNVPITSQFIIIYWTLKHKIQSGVATNEEYEFVMDTLLSYTMGQMFNVRLYAQYLASQLYKSDKANSTQYTYTIRVIEKTFIESSKDKNFVKLQHDYFVNDFDLVKDLTPSFIYYFLPRYCEIDNNEIVDVSFIRGILKDVNINIEAVITNNDLHKEWAGSRRSDEEVFSLNINKYTGNKVIEDAESVGTIQKKYIPWKNMSDINMYDSGKKRQSPSELVVVASLIDKLPNLGGMARTSEVFGVKTYVIDSLRHLQDKQFQGLSVSAERWVDVEEVRPGQPLKEYLIRMKAAGYSVMAAEQTSTSCKLQAFKFPKKTLLLLGHEKEGIPCDLLPIMDYCVEIPQQGFIRSLNVHVTAAIFIWEYARQNIL